MRPEPAVGGVGPSRPEAAVLLQLIQLEILSRPKLEPPLAPARSRGPADKPALVRERCRSYLVIEDRSRPDGCPADPRMDGRVTAVEMRQHVRPPKHSGAVDQHQRTRMVATL